MQIIIKSFIGGAFIGFILWLSQTRFSSLAGLLLFFPIISVPTFFFIGSDGGDHLRDTIIWSFWAVPVWILFALTLYLCSFRLKILPSIVLSLLVWLLGAFAVVYFRTHKGG